MAEVLAFDPIPPRARGDRRLSGAHWRVLATIAGHDRLGKGGGFYAGLRKLATEAQLNYTYTSEIVNWLVRERYVTSEPNRLNRRVVIYRIDPSAYAKVRKYPNGSGVSEDEASEISEDKFGSIETVRTANGQTPEKAASSDVNIFCNQRQGSESTEGEGNLPKINNKNNLSENWADKSDRLTSSDYSGAFLECLRTSRRDARPEKFAKIRLTEAYNGAPPEIKGAIDRYLTAALPRKRERCIDQTIQAQSETDDGFNFLSRLALESPVNRSTGGS